MGSRGQRKSLDNVVCFRRMQHDRPRPVKECFGNSWGPKTIKLNNDQVLKRNYLKSRPFYNINTLKMVQLLAIVGKKTRQLKLRTSLEGWWMVHTTVVPSSDKNLTTSNEELLSNPVVGSSANRSFGVLHSSIIFMVTLAKAWWSYINDVTHILSIPVFTL